MINYLDTLIALVIFWLPLIITMVAGFQLQKIYIRVLRTIGGYPLVLLPASVCVPVHELSHYLMAKLCFHQVTEVKLFSPNKTGTLGYVAHSYRPSWFSPFTNALIGMAPIAGAVGVIYFLTLALFPDVIQILMRMPVPETVAQLYDSLSNLGQIMLWCYEQYKGEWTFWVWGMLVANMAVFGIPSGADFNGAAAGLLLMALCYTVSVSVFGYDTAFHGTMMSLSLFAFPLFLMSVVCVGMLMVALLPIVMCRRMLQRPS